MAKLRGEQKWEHYGDFENELMALEIELDSLSQRMARDHLMLSRALGRVRSIQQRQGFHQMTLKRWSKPAPNQVKLEAVSAEKEREP